MKKKSTPPTSSLPPTISSPLGISSSDRATATSSTTPRKSEDTRSIFSPSQRSLRMGNALLDLSVVRLSLDIALSALEDAECNGAEGCGPCQAAIEVAASNARLLAKRTVAKTNALTLN